MCMGLLEFDQAWPEVPDQGKGSAEDGQSAGGSEHAAQAVEPSRIRCAHCGSDPRKDGFVIEMTAYQAYVPDGSRGLQRHDSPNGIARLVRCLSCSRIIPIAPDKLREELPL